MDNDRAVFLLRHARRNLKADAPKALAEMIDQFFMDNLIIPASLASPMESFHHFATTGSTDLAPLDPWPAPDTPLDLSCHICIDNKTHIGTKERCNRCNESTPSAPADVAKETGPT